jgi:hypothetical protein
MKLILVALALITSPAMAHDVYDIHKINTQYALHPEDVVTAFDGKEHHIKGRLDEVYFDDSVTLFSFDNTRVVTRMASADETDHPRDAVLDSASALVDTFIKGAPKTLTLSCFGAHEVFDTQGRILVLTDCIYIDGV